MTRFEHAQVRIDKHDLHVVSSGDPNREPYVFLHGWPECWCAWHDVMAAAGNDARCIAIDLPGVGASRGKVEGGGKRDLAAVVHGLVEHLGLHNATLVGHDCGGMIAYAYVRAYHDAGVARAVIVNTVIPGLEPWDQVIRNPQIFHFAFHAVPHLPELLVQGHQLPYFGMFYDVLSADPARITPDRRASYASAYGDEASLGAGFDWYRAMTDDAKHNAETAKGAPCETPVLYLRGDKDQLGVEPYAQGFRAAGVRDLATAIIPDSGHFVGDEQPAALWHALSRDRRARPRDAARAGGAHA